MEYISINIKRNELTKSRRSNGKNYRSYYSQRNHDFRNENMTKDYLVNPQDSHLNKILFDNEIKEILDKSNKDYKENSYRNRKKPKNQKEIITGLITFSNTFKIKHNEKFDKAVLAFLKKKFGDSLVYVVLHKDETTPHYHFSLVNHDFQTHKSISRNIDTSKLQDEIGQFFNKSSYKRGITKKQKREEFKKEERRKSNYKFRLEQEIENLKKKGRAMQDQIKKLEVKKDRLEKNIQRDIVSIIKVLEDLNKTTDLDKFIELTKKYMKNPAKLNNLLSKWTKGLSKYQSTLKIDFEKDKQQIQVDYNLEL